LLGTVTPREATSVPEYKRNGIKVGQIMSPKSELIVMQSNRTADEALRRISRENKSRIFVCYEDDYHHEQKEERQILVGLISKTDLLNIAMERKEFEKAIGKFRR
jgi:Mg2+/Co2+ transporter CorC